MSQTDTKYMVVRYYEDFSTEIVLRDLSLHHAKAWVSSDRADWETAHYRCVEKVWPQEENL